MTMKWIVRATLGIALIVVAAPALVLNLGHVYLRDLAMERPSASVPWLVRELPLVRNSGSGRWLTARIERLLEARGAAVMISLAPDAPAGIGRAYADGALRPYTPMEAELLAWSCLSASLTEPCRARLAKEYPETAAALSETGILPAHYVDELNTVSGARLGAALAAGAIDCQRARAFARHWVSRDWFRPAGQAQRS